MIPVFPLLGWEYAKKKRDARKRMDMWGNQWKNRRMILFMIYIYSCLYHLDS